MWLKFLKALVTRCVLPLQQLFLHLDYLFQFLGYRHYRHYTPAAYFYVTRTYEIRL